MFSKTINLCADRKLTE